MLNKKIIIAFIAAIAISLGVCVVTRAEEVPEGYAYSEVGSTEEPDGAPATDVDVNEPEEDPEDDKKSDTGNESSQKGTEPEANTNPFEKVYLVLKEHSGEILGALTFIGSIILAFAYKRGLLPLLRGTLSSLCDSVGTIKKATDESAECNKEFTSLVKERLDSTENTLAVLCEGIDDLCEELYKEHDNMQEMNKLKLIVSSQIDMLYNVFMNSSLPEYQKMAVSEKIQQMREELGK